MLRLVNWINSEMGLGMEQEIGWAASGTVKGLWRVFVLSPM